jgi:hypothetical protein
MRGRDLKPGDKFQTLFGNEYVCIDTAQFHEIGINLPANIVAGLSLTTGKIYSVDVDDMVELINVTVDRDTYNGPTPLDDILPDKSPKDWS